MIQQTLLYSTTGNNILTIYIRIAPTVRMKNVLLMFRYYLKKKKCFPGLFFNHNIF